MPPVTKSGRIKKASKHKGTETALALYHGPPAKPTNKLEKLAEVIKYFYVDRRFKLEDAYIATELIFATGTSLNQYRGYLEKSSTRVSMSQTEWEAVYPYVHSLNMRKAEPAIIRDGRQVFEPEFVKKNLPRRIGPRRQIELRNRLTAPIDSTLQSYKITSHPLDVFVPSSTWHCVKPIPDLILNQLPIQQIKLPLLSFCQTELRSMGHNMALSHVADHRYFQYLRRLIFRISNNLCSSLEMNELLNMVMSSGYRSALMSLLSIQTLSTRLVCERLAPVLLWRLDIELLEHIKDHQPEYLWKEFGFGWLSVLLRLYLFEDYRSDIFDDFLKEEDVESSHLDSMIIACTNEILCQGLDDRYGDTQTECPLSKSQLAMVLGAQILSCNCTVRDEDDWFSYFKNPILRIAVFSSFIDLIGINLIRCAWHALHPSMFLDAIRLLEHLGFQDYICWNLLTALAQGDWGGNPNTGILLQSSLSIVLSSSFEYSESTAFSFFEILLSRDFEIFALVLSRAVTARYDQLVFKMKEHGRDPENISKGKCVLDLCAELLLLSSYFGDEKQSIRGLFLEIFSTLFHSWKNKIVENTLQTIIAHQSEEWSYRGLWDRCLADRAPHPHEEIRIADHSSLDHELDGMVYIKTNWLLDGMYPTKLYKEFLTLSGNKDAELRDNEWDGSYQLSMSAYNEDTGWDHIEQSRRERKRWNLKFPHIPFHHPLADTLLDIGVLSPHDIFEASWVTDASRVRMDPELQDSDRDVTSEDKLKFATQERILVLKLFYEVTRYTAGNKDCLHSVEGLVQLINSFPGGRWALKIVKFHSNNHSILIDITTIQLLASMGRIDLLQQFYSNHTNAAKEHISMRYHYSPGPLECAVMANSLECCQFLLDNGADINKFSSYTLFDFIHRNFSEYLPCWYSTPLLYAVTIGSLNIAKFLLERGANPSHHWDPTSGSDDAPIAYAVSERRLDFVSLFISFDFRCREIALLTAKSYNINIILDYLQQVGPEVVDLPIDYTLKAAHIPKIVDIEMDDFSDSAKPSGDSGELKASAPSLPILSPNNVKSNEDSKYHSFERGTTLPAPSLLSGALQETVAIETKAIELNDVAMMISSSSTAESRPEPMASDYGQDVEMSCPTETAPIDTSTEMETQLSEGEAIRSLDDQDSDTLLENQLMTTEELEKILEIKA